MAYAYSELYNIPSVGVHFLLSTVLYDALIFFGFTNE